MFEKRKILKYLIIFGAVLVLPFAIYHEEVSIKREAKIGYKIFNRSMVDGKIIKISSSNGLSYIKLDNADTEYIFMPRKTVINNDRNFYLTAKVGDSIYKMPYSDTLILTHKWQKYYYTFTKFK